MRFHGTVKTLGFDANGYTVAMKKQLEIAYRKAAAEFLRAAIPLVPVDTGMARGSFLNIGRFLRVAVPISPKPRKTAKLYYHRGAFSPGERMNPELGASYSTKVEDLFKWKANKLSFQFNTRVYHYNLLDAIGVRGQEPWNSFSEGQKAFIESLSGLSKRLPKITDFIILTNVTFGQGSGVTSDPPFHLTKQRTVRDG